MSIKLFIVIGNISIYKTYVIKKNANNCLFLNKKKKKKS